MKPYWKIRGVTFLRAATKLWSLALDISILKQASPSEKPVTQYGFNWDKLFEVNE